MANGQWPIGRPAAGRRAVSICSDRSAFSPLAPRPSPLACHAFTLLEILVAVGLLSVIVLGLFAMFNQTQRAFRLSMNQSDILGAGRAVTEMIPRELEQMTPSCYPHYPFPHGVNFYVATPYSALNAVPLLQPLPASGLERTNLLQDCFLLLRQNQMWVGIGYLVRATDANGRLVYPETEAGKIGAGALYRFTATLPAIYQGAAQDARNGLAQNPSQLFDAFRAVSTPGSPASLAVSNRICDGVVHFRLRAFDTNGVLITTNYANVAFQYSPIAPGEVGLYAFCSNALPAAVELELGLLEQHAWERYNSIGNATARRAYLQRDDTTSRVHLFRQRVPVRNVDPSAYR